MYIANPKPQINYIGDETSSPIAIINYHKIIIHPEPSFKLLFSAEQLSDLKEYIHKHMQTLKTPTHTIRYFSINVDGKSEEYCIKTELLGDNLLLLLGKEEVIVPSDIDISNAIAPMTNMVMNSYRTSQASTIPFHIRMTLHFKEKHISKTLFSHYGLPTKLYRNMKSPGYQPSLSSLVAVAIITDMPLLLVCDMLESMGRKFKPDSLLHNAYIYLINNHQFLINGKKGYADKDLLNQCDELLIALGFTGCRELLSVTLREK